MRKKIKYIVLVLSCIAMFSCDEDFLENKPLDKFSEEDVWNDVNLAQGFIYRTYGQVMIEMVKNPLGQWNAPGSFSDDFTDNVAISNNNIVAKDLLDKNFDAGWDVFEIIRNTNLIIDRVAASEGITEALKGDLIAQGKVLRAMIYYSRARLFGKYIIIDKVLTPEDDLKLSRSSTIKEVYDFILNDLAEAAIDLPATAEAGRLTQGAAYALIAEIALHAAAYSESGKNEFYQMSKKASEDLFGLGYSLDTDYSALTSDYNFALNSNEIILGYFRHADITQTKRTPQQRIVPNCSDAKNHPWVQPKLVESIEGWAGRWPSNELVNDYLVIDAADNTAKRWNETSQYLDFMANGGYVSKAIFKNRDARFYASIAHDSSKYFNNLITIRKGGNMHWTSNAAGNWSMTKSGFYFRKSVFEGVKLWANDFVPFHHSIMRLGRSYLNYAEVMLRLNDPAKALEYINMTRVAHGGLPELSTGLSIDEAWDYYKIERRVELFFENDRYWSLLRWGKEAGLDVIPELNSGQTFFEVSEDGMSYEIIEQPLNKSENERVFTSRRYLFPVPEKEILLNGNLDQNPGY
ncbi:RagB/SusD family nutrient uptake outer membrane protein [Flavivirga algicola]|uniref:RagB/SusD family nutrient uptake outer membrane protein n=1 Tax=Flavivirga algicola TaxID=2729136 RepID=A0ABX1RX11_9FLAO|nr:RagB/SusD family nutrient uptake outer membrane protein [Flavivirga algicola]NMH86875.1 RagB/SusD family nutrient uptake outer membrane protein [Flavivirga algicola]